MILTYLVYFHFPGSMLLLATVLLFSAQITAAAGGSAKAPAPALAKSKESTSQVEDAELFRLYYGQSFKVVKNSLDGQSYLLMQNTSSMALRTKYCTGRIKSFVVPLLNYSVDTPFFPVSFFELLGLLDGLKGITSESIASQCVLKLYSNGNIQIINRTDTSQFGAYFTSNIGKQQSCNFAAFLPLEERTPLQKAEWIKYLAAFTNSEARANVVYDAIKGNYNCLSKAAVNLTSRFKPVVAWVDYSQAMWTFSREEYKLKYVSDAGGENVDASISYHSYNVSNPDDMESFHALLCTVDVVIDQTYAPEPAEYTLSTFQENFNVGDDTNFDFLRNQSLWRFDKRVQNSSALAICHGHGSVAFSQCLREEALSWDWYDGAISQPHLVLADLIEIFFPTGNYTLTYFRNIAKNEGVIAVGPESCNRSPSTAMEPIIVQC